ncbi:MAG: type II toxin-antitoxin system VapC family toxin [Terriglobales bacterium]
MRATLAQGPVYLDSSALIKLIIPEPETEALESFLVRYGRRASSVLTEVEVMRVLLRLADETGAAAQRASRALAAMSLLALDTAVLQRAARLPPPRLRSLDALHLASALLVPDCAGMVTYDRRLREAAVYHGLQVWWPGA